MARPAVNKTGVEGKSVDACSPGAAQRCQCRQKSVVIISADAAAPTSPVVTVMDSPARRASAGLLALQSAGTRAGVDAGRHSSAGRPCAFHPGGPPDQGRWQCRGAGPPLHGAGLRVLLWPLSRLPAALAPCAALRRPA